MSFDRNFLNPNVETHVPIKVNIPDENASLGMDRPDLPTPSLWQHSVTCTHKATKKRAVVARVDWGTNLFRAYYPDDIDPVTGKPGRFSDRTEWEQCSAWDVDVTFSPKELERQASLEKLKAEMALLDADSLAAVMVLCDDPDPAKALGKLEALRRLGVVKVSSAVAPVLASEVKKGK